MDTPHIEMRYFETYYFASVVHGTLANAEHYLRSLHEWGGDERDVQFLQAYPRWSHLHSLIAFVVDRVIDERIDEAKLEPWFDGKYEPLWIDQALEFHDIKHDGFDAFLSLQARSRRDADENDVYEYHQQLMLGGELTLLTNRISEEVFYLAFSNRSLLLDFNGLARVYVSGLEDTSDARLSRAGVLKRVSPPMWAKRAVFYRDRGRCANCNRDLTGLVSLQNSEYFDHIVPLALSGLNDVSNLQLLCLRCNSAKGARATGVSSRYEGWYPMREQDKP